MQVLPYICICMLTHTHLRWVSMFYGDFYRDIIVFILYKLYILAPYTNPTPKRYTSRKTILDFQKNIMLYD